MRISDWSSDVCSSDLSANDEYVIDGTLVRNIDKVTEASVSLRFDQTDSLSLLGPRNGNPDDPRRRDSRSQNWTSSASVNGMRSEERRVGTDVSVRVDLGGRRIIKKKKKINNSK